MNEPVRSDETNERICARVVPDNGHKRAHERYELELEVDLHVQVPSRTAEGFRLNGRTDDLSLLGMGVNVEKLHVDEYRTLINHSPVLSVAFEDPTTGKPVRVQGKIAWVDYRKSRATNTIAPCRLGIRFNELSDSQIRPFRLFIDKIEPI